MNARQLSQDERTWAMLAHLGGLLTLFTFFFGWVPAFVIWLAYKDESPHVEREAREALSFQLWVLIVSLAVLVMTLGLAILLYPVWFLWCLLWPLVGAVRASSGRSFRYPLILRLVPGPDPVPAPPSPPPVPEPNGG